MYMSTNKPQTYNPSSSSLIPSNVRAGNELLKDEDEDLSIRTLFDFFRAGVSIPSSSESTLTLRERVSFSTLLVLARPSERFNGTFFGRGSGVWEVFCASRAAALLARSAVWCRCFG
jgi:hypothetical protein